MDETGKSGRDEIYSNVVRAGQRTYFFDVRTTRDKGGYYLTVTESKKRYHQDGEVSYQKHKIFLYQEDFEKVRNAMADAFEKVADLNRNLQQNKEDETPSTDFSVDFEDLGDSGETVTAETEDKEKEE